MHNPYARRKQTSGQSQRVVILVPTEELKAIDAWGVPAGMDSRTAAFRALLKKGLEAAARERESSHVAA
ncbi:hypothetical protein [Methylobacterium aquaticum]|uniref:hypothetical protein n=1 Tax=Methylobacterium aquaticum TaxID=270351 RepID=UPI001934A26A|nr:hypothetical protein [Methylobacterium aquaticum]